MATRLQKGIRGVEKTARVAEKTNPLPKRNPFKIVQGQSIMKAERRTKAKLKDLLGFK